MPKNLLTKAKDHGSINQSMIDPKQINSITQTLSRVLQENHTFYFYIGNKTIEAKVDYWGILHITSALDEVVGAKILKFKLDKINRASIEYCAKRAIEVLG